MRNDNRYVAELPSGIIRNPQLIKAGVDFDVNDVITVNDGIAMPMYSEDQSVDGIAAAKGIKGKMMLVAT